MDILLLWKKTNYDNNSVTLWMALDDAMIETGCLEYIPKSHTQEWMYDDDDLFLYYIVGFSQVPYPVNLPKKCS